MLVHPGRFQVRGVEHSGDRGDEAADPLRLVVELLEPLASAAGRTRIRLLAATRPGGDGELLSLFGSSALILDLDAPAYLQRGDVEEYVRRTLLASDDPFVSTPFRGRPDLAAVVAGAVAERAGPCFLVAQLSALSLMGSSDPPVVMAGWTDDFPATVGAAMERYLRQAQSGGGPARDLLTALAWTEGDGLDDMRVWADVATAIGTGAYTEHDVARMLAESTAADLLHRTRRDGRTAFRLFHEALSEHLQRQSMRYREPADTQRRVADVLIAHVPRTNDDGPDWSRADYYTRTYLPGHAAQGQILDSLLGQTGFLATAEPARLLAALPAALTPRGQRVARIVERVGQQLLQAPQDERACYLEMAAQMAGDDQLARDAASFAPHRPWSVPWARWQALDDSRLLGHHDDWVSAVTTVDTTRGTIVVSASAWAVRAWYLADGTPAAGMREPSSRITAMTAFSDAGDVVVLTMHENGDLRRAVLGAATLPRTIAGNRADGLWLIRHNGGLAVVTINDDDVAEVLSVSDGEPVGLAPVNVAGKNVYTAATAGHRGFLVAGTYDEEDESTTEVAILDLADGTTVGSPVRPAEHFPRHEPVSIWRAALFERDSSPLLLCCPDFRGPAVVWDPIKAQLASEPHYDDVGVTCAAIGRTGNRDLLCWGDVNGDLYLQEHGTKTVSRRAAHDAGINAITTCDTSGGLVVITGSRDGAVRTWQVTTARAEPSQPRAADLAIVPAHGKQGTMIVSLTGRRDAVAVLDAADGRVLAQWKPAAGEHYWDIAARVGREPALVTVDSRNQVAVWQPPVSQPQLTWQLPGEVKPRRIAVTGGAEPVLLVTSADGLMAFFDLASGEAVREPLRCHAGPFGVVTDPDQPPGVIRFLTVTWREPREVRLWSLTASEARCRDLPAESDQSSGLPGAYVISASILGGQVIVGVGSHASLFTWDAESGALLADVRLERAHHMALGSVDVAEIAGRKLILCGGYNCSLTLLPMDAQGEHNVRVGCPLFSVKAVGDDRVVVAGVRGVMLVQLSAHLPGL